MPSVSDIIPSLSGGVSQQPASTRVPGKCDDASRNVIFSLLEGADKRPPSEFLARLFAYGGGNPSAADNPFIRFINRDETNRYMVWIQGGDVRVFNMADGAEETVAMDPGTDAYVTAANAKEDLGMLTVGDTSFVFNRNTVVANDAAESDPETYQAIVWVKAGAFGRRYSVTINGTEYYYVTPNGTNSSHTYTSSGENIASILCGGNTAWASIKTANGQTNPDGASVSTNGLSSLGGGFTVTQRGTTILISSSSDFTITVDDGQNRTGMDAIKGAVSQLSDLPSRAFDGVIVRVGKTTAESDTDYYVRFDDPDDDGTGVWAETVAPATVLGLDASTMPHRLVNNGDGTWTFSQVPYTQRQCGTEDSAPDPTFVGRTINHMVYMFDRLGIMSGEDVHYGAARDLFRFYRASAIAKADDDPFAITAAAEGVSILRYHVGMEGANVFFAAQRQFQLERSSERFSALGAQLLESKAYDFNPACEPERSGDSIFFASLRGSYTTPREYRPRSAITAEVSDEVGVDIPKYLPAATNLMAAAPTEGTLVTCACPSGALYVYRWADIDGRRLLSAWNKWEFAHDILAADFFGSKLYLCLDSTADGVVLEVVSLAPQERSSDLTYKVRLDGLLHSADLAAISYNSTTNRSTITLPYKPTGITLSVLGRATEDSQELTEYTVVSSTSTTLVVSGDLTGVEFWVGRPYQWRYRFSTIYARENGPPQTGAPMLDGRLQIADVAVEVCAPYYIVASVTNENRAPWVTRHAAYTAELLDDAAAEDGRKSSFIRFGVKARNTRTIIELQNDTYLPCQILSAQWRGQFNPKVRQV